MRVLATAIAACVALAPPFASSSAAQTPSPAEQIYTSVYPCRVFDTRTTSRIPTRGTRNFFVAGPENYAGQGGARDGCGVPLWATAVSISLSATSSSAAGYLIPHAFGASRPNVVALSYHPSLPALTAGATPAIRNGKLSIYASQATHVIGDVTGYFAPQIAVDAGSDGQIISKSGRSLTVQRLSIGSYVAELDRDATGCTAVATPRSIFQATDTFIEGNRVFVYLHKVTGSSAVVIDGPFRLVVTC